MMGFVEINIIRYNALRNQAMLNFFFSHCNTGQGPEFVLCNCEYALPSIRVHWMVHARGVVFRLFKSPL